VGKKWRKPEWSEADAARKEAEQASKERSRKGDERKGANKERIEVVKAGVEEMLKENDNKVLFLQDCKISIVDGL